MAGLVDFVKQCTLPDQPSATYMVMDGLRSHREDSAEGARNFGALPLPSETMTWASAAKNLREALGISGLAEQPLIREGAEDALEAWYWRTVQTNAIQLDSCTAEQPDLPSRGEEAGDAIAEEERRAND